MPLLWRHHAQATTEEPTTEEPTTEEATTEEPTTEESTIEVETTEDVTSGDDKTITDETVNEDEMPEIEKDEENIVYEVEVGVKVYGEEAFHKDTVVKVEYKDSGKEYKNAENVLRDIVDKDNMVVFEITALLDNKKVQPNGKVKVEFEIPKKLSPKNLKMFFVAENGEKEEIKISVEDGKVTAELTHFSTYVLCNVVSNKSLNLIPIVVVTVVVIMGAGVSAFVIIRCKRLNK